ncbi:unnamed protein product, partial [Rotaria sp. Silwood1]
MLDQQESTFEQGDMVPINYVNSDVKFFYHNSQVLYPYNKNNYCRRTHDNCVAIAQAAVVRSCSRKKGSIIDGVKGLSPQLKIFEYSKQIVLDYMHLCCLRHMLNLIQRWLPVLNNEALQEINNILFSQKFPHNMSVTFNYPFQLS